MVEGSKFVADFQKTAKKYIGQIRKGGQSGLKAAQQLAKEAQGPCKRVNKVLSKGVIQKIPIPNINIVAAAIHGVCAIIINEGIPTNTNQLQKFVDALKGL